MQLKKIEDIPQVSTQDNAVMDRARVRSWHAWLALGVLFSLAIGMSVVADRKGYNVLSTTTAPAAIISAVGATSEVGSWGPTFPMRVPLPPAPPGKPATKPFVDAVAIHATLLPETNKVWMAYSTGLVPGPGTLAWVWDADTGAITNASIPYAYDMMCGGHTLTSDGYLWVAGGRNNAQKTATYDADENEWIPGPNMVVARYYPTALTLGDGSTLVAYGSGSITIEQYDSKLNTIKTLPKTVNRVNIMSYPRLHLLPDGNVFHAGAEKATKVLNTQSWTWSPLGGTLTANADNGVSVQLPGDGWKFLSLGGAYSQTRAQVIDLRTDTTWRTISPMATGRANFNAVTLPDGNILVLGGTNAAATKNIEMFYPATEKFAVMAPANPNRAYHSTATLLPSGQVLYAGNQAPFQSTGAIYSPPYLFKGTRPVISIDPASRDVVYGGNLSVQNDDLSVTRMTLVRMGPNSHGTNNEQRHIELEFATSGSQLAVAMPTNPNLAPPGFYMMFGLNAAGVPSTAVQIKLQAAE
ncbi:MAG: hypothetical protein A3C84_02085 [Candidatus Ryanbacteria bacterium RIFCSPHIGHO2_02_FULL_48_12]|uniref:Galactose oxidase-like Early set domain-containing protein n=1 Tax=Candidatus Ryanbacteria bacterium RIFCSPHIGHO2_01_FULL_48_27 TaxID=1802115 RepID=A0A1G2G415_9BACT|nr:MAG: hypothetical protein A2756_04515 [Candidatus Ryanbacteria bacterium RIFCSPHIGHO2_01_FULL_48_27]OGZ49242.1 MAG: hypothetical protein A3C84_02085 [Candidatus Ryanbacteria bacterium RIFCSPHIGHO2_02_FULL_48_12]